MQNEFKLDSTKQGHKVIFGRKTRKLHHSSFVFNNTKVTQSIYQKHLVIIVGSKSTFDNHLRMVTNK